MRARETMALEQALQVEPARQVLRRVDHRQQAALALLLQLEPVAHGHGHAHRLHQRRLARIARRQRVDQRQAARELVGRCALVQQVDQVAHRLLVAIDVDRASHHRASTQLLTATSKRRCRCARITLGFAAQTGETRALAVAPAEGPPQAPCRYSTLFARLPNLRVLVTAGAGGVGAAIARAFHEAGSRVHVCDVDRSALDRLTAGVPGITGSMADASLSCRRRWACSTTCAARSAASTC